MLFFSIFRCVEWNGIARASDGYWFGLGYDQRNNELSFYVVHKFMYSTITNVPSFARFVQCDLPCWTVSRNATSKIYQSSFSCLKYNNRTQQPIWPVVVHHNFSILLPFATLALKPLCFHIKIVQWIYFYRTQHKYIKKRKANEMLQTEEWTRMREKKIGKTKQIRKIVVQVCNIDLSCESILLVTNATIDDNRSQLKHFSLESSSK